MRRVKPRLPWSECGILRFQGLLGVAKSPLSPLIESMPRNGAARRVIRQHASEGQSVSSSTPPASEGRASVVRAPATLKALGPEFHVARDDNTSQKSCPCRQSEALGQWIAVSWSGLPK